MAVSQRCKVEFGNTQIPTRHYLLVGAETVRYTELLHKVTAEYRKPEFKEAKELAALYWIDSENDEILLDSQEAYDSALSYLVPDAAGICFLKLFAKSRHIGDGLINGRRNSQQSQLYIANGSVERQTRPTTSSLRPWIGGRGFDIAQTLLPVPATRSSAHSDAPSLGNTNTRKAAYLELSEEEGFLDIPGSVIQKAPGMRGAKYRCHPCRLNFHTDVLLEAHNIEVHIMDEPRVLRGNRLNAPISSDIRGRRNGSPPNRVEESSDEEKSVERKVNLRKLLEHGQATVESVPNGAKFPCPKCTRVFENVKQLRGHQAAHSTLRHRRARKARPMKKDHMPTDEDGEEVFRTVGPVAGMGEESAGKTQPDGPMDLTNEDDADKSREISAELASDNLEVIRRSLQTTDGPRTAVEPPSEDAFPCPKCDRSFRFIRQLRGHQAAHTDSNTSRRRRKKKRSVSSVYGVEEEQFPPTMMAALNGDVLTDGQGKKRRRSSSAIVHNMIMSPMKMVKSDSVLARSSDENPDGMTVDGKFPCSKCDRLFETKRQLQGHQALHSVKGKFVCQMCQQGFRTRDVLDIHQSQCTGEVMVEGRSFFCVANCGRMFATRKTLVAHRQHCGFYRESSMADAEDSGEEALAGPLVEVGSNVSVIASRTRPDLDGTIETMVVAPQRHPHQSSKAVTPVPFADDMPHHDLASLAEKEPLDHSTTTLRHLIQREKVIVATPTRRLDEGAREDMPKFFVDSK